MLSFSYFLKIIFSHPPLWIDGRTWHRLNLNFKLVVESQSHCRLKYSCCAPYQKPSLTSHLTFTHFDVVIIINPRNANKALSLSSPSKFRSFLPAKYRTLTALNKIQARMLMLGFLRNMKMKVWGNGNFRLRVSHLLSCESSANLQTSFVISTWCNIQATPSHE